VNKQLSILLLSVSANTPLMAQDALKALIDEQNFARWTVEGASKAAFTLEGNVVRGKPVGHKPKNSFLCSPDEYKDFELSFSFRISDPILNSGVQFRSAAHAEGVRGPQFEMDVAQSGDFSLIRRIGEPIYNFLTGRVAFDWSTAGVYGEDMGTGWLDPGLVGGEPDAFEAQGATLTNPEGWNEVRLLAVGPSIKTWQAGEARADFEYAETDKPGKICLQVHGGSYEDPDSLFIEWRDLRIRTVE